jgi:nucleotide-binding universal stress UspA family protein
VAELAPRRSAALEPGQQVDGFLLEERTHVGGMAQLWRVSRPGSTDPMPLIMKVPRLKGGDDPTTIVGFEVEQMILPGLTGIHVPRFVAQGDFTQQPYIVMERIDGATLKARFDAAPLPCDEVAAIGANVASALHDLHRQHVIHLDVKPSNILFRPVDASVGAGAAVLVDFGLSRHDHLPDLLEEEFELPMGTGPYVSPEQVQFVRNDPRSDLFALGVVLYHLTTGQRPFGAPTSVRGLRARLYRDPIPPRNLRPDCPPWLQEVILACLEMRPAKRPQSGAQLAFDLLHPEQVVLTERATRNARSGAVQVARRWFAAIGAEPAAGVSAAAHAVRNPILLAALDVAGADPTLLAGVRDTAQRLLNTEPGARLACVAVMKTNRLAMDEPLDKDGSSKHVNLLVQLKHWARELRHPRATGAADPAGHITFHVLEAPDPAGAIVEFASKNQVDHIVMGARGSGGLRRHLGSVSARVAAEAECTVTVVRALTNGRASEG